jgi:hypothetical protein
VFENQCDGTTWGGIPIKLVVVETGVPIVDTSLIYNPHVRIFKIFWNRITTMDKNNVISSPKCGNDQRTSNEIVPMSTTLMDYYSHRNLALVCIADQFVHVLYPI